MTKSFATARKTKVEQTSLLHPLDFHFNLFIRSKEVEGLKPRTISDHKIFYSYFRRWLSVYYPALTVDQLTADIVRQYIHYMLTEQPLFDGHKQLAKFNDRQGLSPATVNIRTRSLKCFLKFLYDEGHLSTNIAPRLKLQKVPIDTIGAFSKEEMLLLLSAPNQREFVGFRDYVLMVVLFDTGMRINEVLNMLAKDIDFIHKSIHIPATHSKNGQARTVPITKRTCDLLSTLLAENQEQFSQHPDHLFLARDGKPMTYLAAYTRISHYGKQVGITGTRVSPHTFRHTFATHYVSSGGNIFSLQKILGHSDMSMVRKYVQLTQSDLQKHHEKNSPLADLL
ncbi:tyrosine-type recombinase/integrase [Brevibacillus invocatus]|uniref:tyrosine-type recombinase/integrase n=1 Tax=Brevibacillus invocatus TaxID=173959 RepID=UPI00203BE830|nr:tyrosine-type recombinase/integrase [Brevibacillus invocatus]MCM3078500.1 tyrosine-type recombinase/integrase [Brevibacillus invocatus]MCM3430922.1 tyrosine-type recombinase/integrase [Brevibacillus invocatus]